MSVLHTVLLHFTAWVCAAGPPVLDERPAASDEWGYHPAAGAALEVNPPAFSWRPQKEIVSWELECGRGKGFAAITYHAAGIAFNVHCPPHTFPPGSYTWHYRGVDKSGQKTAWSSPRTFTISAGAKGLPMPPREELLGRVPKSHPRLFVRPEDLPRLRELAKGPLKDEFQKLCAQCDKLLASPPPTAEPPKYPPEINRKSDEWAKIWWGNRVYTMAALDGAATLGFTRLVGGKQEYGQLARRILMDSAKWDPKGATGYRYNDEAGMPYASRFSRTYTFVYDLLTDEQRRLCREVMKVRGEEMYRHLCPGHLWRPYASHSNRAWHFLGEPAVAFLGEIEGADDWLWFAMNVFFNVYPVWSDDDGGWHEGTAYWAAYIERFTWWADIMRSAMGINAYDKPYFSKVGYYGMYLMPPGMVGGGFGDLNGPRTASQNVVLMSQLAAQAGNGHWQWYVQQMGGPIKEPGYVGFVRGALPAVKPKAPDDLPTSCLFRGTGQAYLNTTLANARQDVQVAFKSSPFGTQSHGYDANNSFLLWAYGQRLLVSSGYRDLYGSDHHKNWMWSTRSVNNITVNGQGQLSRSPSSQGRIVAFATTPSIDAVAGETGQAYRAAAGSEPLLDRFTRTILFLKPELVIIFDRLAARQDSTFQYWLHALNEIAVPDQRNIVVRAGDVLCDIAFLAPDGLTFAQTNQYDPNPRPKITLREWHLTASTPGKQQTVEFVTLYRPHLRSKPVAHDAQLKPIKGGYLLTAGLSDGSVLALLPTDDTASFTVQGRKVSGTVVVQRRRADGSVAETVKLEK